MEKRVEETRVALQHLEMHFINAACDDPGEGLDKIFCMRASYASYLVGDWISVCTDLKLINGSAPKGST